MKWSIRETMGMAMAALAVLAFHPVGAQQQFQGWCAQVKIEILQELAIERIGFEATLQVTNNEGEDAITDFFAELTFETFDGEGNALDASHLFFVRTPTLRDVNAVDGTGVIGPTKTAVVKWFIIPKPAAGGTNPLGIDYRIGARLSGKLAGLEIPKENMFVLPDRITVRPEAQLDITYFLPRDVQGDNPFTPEVESPIPFTLGVLVKNVGYGMARNVTIQSQQPRIVENVQRLLLVAQLLGARVMDSPLDRASLTVNLGDIPPGEARKGAWDMIVSLSGEFIEFKASYTHASDLGGEETSLISSLEAHFFVREMMVDMPGRDDVLDFLAVTDRNPALIPDAIYESNGNVLPVNHLQDIQTLQGLDNDGVFKLGLHSDFEGWGYIRLDDPSQGRLGIVRATRSDGKVLHPRNIWQNHRYHPSTNQRLDYLNIVDLVEVNAVYDYTIEFAPAVDPHPPVTGIYFAGEHTESGGVFYVTRDTQIYFIAEDESPVSMFYKIDDGDFVPALPFQIQQPGQYLITYYSRDIAGNVEEEKTATVVLWDEAPVFDGFDVSPASLFVSGDILSVRPGRITIPIPVAENPTVVEALVDVFAGVSPAPALGGHPLSPTPFNSATLQVGGDHVDFYRYRLGSGPWSAEREVTRPLVLEGLSGNVTVDVLGRFREGNYPSDDHAVRVSWTVNPGAPPLTLEGFPSTPSRSQRAVLQIGGAGVSEYRWTLDEGFFRAAVPVSEPLELTQLSPGGRVLGILGLVNGTWQSTENPSRIHWTVDPMHGAEMSHLNLVYSESFWGVQGQTVPFVWDGSDQYGNPLPAGWYTVRVILRDALNRTSFASRLVRLENLASDASLLAEAARAAARPHARGEWAVWQDRANGVWNIAASRLNDPDLSILAVTGGTLPQENPRTDGRYAVWQGRSTGGSWDIWMRDLQSMSPAQRLTSDPDRNDTKPVIEWPWVVYQSRPLGEASAPWQLYAHNLATGQTSPIDSTTQDQIDADIHGGRVVWQDWRDVGSGEIYWADLETGMVRRLTNSVYGQYHPRIFDHWVVWQDNRHTQVEIYGFDLLRDREVRLSNTPYNEARPFLLGRWLVCEEDSAGVNLANMRLINLDTLQSVPVTNTLSLKGRPAMASGMVLWEETEGGLTELRTAVLPALQGVFQNNNAVALTSAMVDRFPDAHSLLDEWVPAAGVLSVSRYVSLWPEVAVETAVWQNGGPSGENFPLQAGNFLWVYFSDDRVLELGSRLEQPLSLAQGVNAFSYSAFPPNYHARALVEQLGAEAVRAVRMLDAGSSLWRTMEVVDGNPVGPNFAIPEVAVLFIDMKQSVGSWRPVQP